MAIFEHSNFDVSKREIKNHDTRILLGYSFVAIVLLIAICLGSLSCGTEIGDFATMTVFP